jgi:hypothetical protein
VVGVTSELLEKARRAVLDLPGTVFVRSGDALHLACAEEQVAVEDPSGAPIAGSQAVA